jgi:Skp family chaperone for outer membrane proteins
MTESEKMETEETMDTSDPEESPDFAYEGEVVQDRKGLGLIPVLGLSLLAALLGAVGGAIGGAYGTHYLFPPTSADDLRAAVQQDVGQLKTKTQAEINDIRQELSDLETRLSQTSSETEIQSFITGIEERLQRLENAPAPSLPDIDPDSLNALKAAQNDGFNWPETNKIDSQIANLNSKTEALEAQIVSLNAQIESLEGELEARDAQSKIVQPETDDIKSIGPEFPKQALLNAARNRAESQGFLSRTLNKHVSVDSPDSPKNLIEKIEIAYEKDDIYTAIKTFDRLPSEIRSAGQDWRDAAERLQ